MDHRGADIITLAQAQMRLPEHLRTEHWYNDWQHAVFIITFDHLMQALRRDHTAVAERLIDKLTVYLYVHFLCEEEGMAWALSNGAAVEGKISQHQAFHVRFLDYWHDSIQRPFKTGDLTGRRLAIKIQDFYEKVLHHIDEEDQTTYGCRSGRVAGLCLDEAAHIAQSGLPLSPNSPGAVAIVQACSSQSAGLLRREALPIKAVEPMRLLKLAPGGLGAPDSVRERVLRATGQRIAQPILRIAA